MKSKKLQPGNLMFFILDNDILLTAHCLCTICILFLCVLEELTMSFSYYRKIKNI